MLIINFYDFIHICSQKIKSDISWGETGPRLVHALVNKHGLREYVKDTQFFNPVDYFHFNQILIKRDNEIDLSLSVAVHLWNEMWRRKGINKDDNFPVGSLFENLKSKYL